MLTRKEVKVILLTALVTLAIIGVFDKFIRTHQADRPESDHASLKFAALTGGECSISFVPRSFAHTITSMSAGKDGLSAVPLKDSAERGGEIERLKASEQSVLPPQKNQAFQKIGRAH
jgi:hypothetical protein